MSGYFDVSVIVKGALDSFETFSDTSRGRLAKETFLGSLEREAKRETFRAEVFEVFHGHDLTEDECSCVQYLTDHHPDYVFGPDGREDS